MKRARDVAILVLLSFLCVLGKYITNDQRQYVNSFYGDKFSVDEDYPDEVDVYSYADLNESLGIPQHYKNTFYPDKLFLAIIHTIPSKLHHVEKTRQTWCNPQYQNEFGMKCIFVLVRETVEKKNMTGIVSSLNNTYHDLYYIEMPNLKEHWFTLQQKNVNAYILAKTLFPDYLFYSRVDDEIIVTVDTLADLLVSLPKKNTVVGEFVRHRPNKNVKNKYYDPLAINIKKYFFFPAGYLSIWSSDIIDFIASWENYYTIAPSSLEDPGFGHFLYKYYTTTNNKLYFVTPEKWGGNTGTHYGDYMVFHDQRGRLNQTKILERRIADGHFVN
ncbi:hypothetical protein EIN_093620 [Entamoeba invadens IP1]|uniref:Hexosyltransferase n=1 Tax=Entamoeba invadens IP1 TaxID=370355 RepID=A0A0A1TZY2_ENTIV|nr:hypothetical protein EIN_093620 [Entamoeba invadens IP1]ELP87205.1 hypothetical protein EIN_093620 [Entamoeba invadens IP1]|eukprot:XP_004253976.1 hypothetical protein EIN_093620 [Entamoeba invadens IP1]